MPVFLRAHRRGPAPVRRRQWVSLQTWEALGDCVCGVHVKDSRPEGLSGRAEALPGSGDVPVVQLLKLLREIEFAGPVALEWEKYWHPELPDLEAALKSMSQAGWRAF